MSSEYVAAPVRFISRRNEYGALQATLLLAVLFHLFALMVVVVYSPNKEGASFFSDLKDDVVLRPVTMVDAAIPKPAVPPPKPAQPKAPPPTDKPNPDPGPGKPGPVDQPRASSAPKGGGSPRIVNAPRSSWTLQQGQGYRGQGRGTGNGDGTGTGNGYGNGGDGGNGGNGSGPQMNVEAGGVLSEYNAFVECQIPFPSGGGDPMQRAMYSKSWEELCGHLGVSWDEIRSRAHVKPFLLNPYVPPIHEQYQLGNRLGYVSLSVTVGPDGRTQVALNGTSGDQLIDRIGYDVGVRTTWLPALSNGRPVTETVIYAVQFGKKGSGPGPLPGGPPPGDPPPGDPGAPPGQAPPGS